MKNFLFIFFNFHITVLICFAQWTQVSTISTTQLNDVKFFNEYTGITVGNLGIWRTTNSGINWEQVLVSGDMFNAVSFSDISFGTAVGMNGLIYRTSNGGINWFQQFIGSGISFFDVSFPTISTGYVCGATNGYVFKTSNGGSSWISQWTQINVTYYGIYMLNQNTGSLVGIDNSERYFGTVNGGTNWTPTVLTGNVGLRSVTQSNALNIIATGTNGRIRLSTNGGSGWVFPVSGTNQVLNAVTFINLSNGYISSDSGIVLKSTNGGFNWVREQTSVTNNLKGISLINDETGWAVGANGIIIRKGTFTKIRTIGSKVPSDFSLYQNYPNPFNPKTVIRFQVASYRFIKLTVFDVIGREVATLVDEQLKAGTYEADWDASNYPSGVYFYRLSSESYTETKRMVLIK